MSFDPSRESRRLIFFAYLSVDMPEEVLFETERRHDRTDIAAYLRNVADKLDSGEPIAFSAGDQSVELDPPARPTFEVKVERETSRGSSKGELSIELELEWDEGESGNGGGDLEIA